MTEVVIAGIGQTPVGEHWDISIRELALQAIDRARADAGGLQPQALYVANMLAAPLSQQAHLGALVADFAGLNGVEAVTIEAAGASGGAALRVGYLAVASGQVDAALVVGVEKFTDQVGGAIDAALSATGDSDFEAVQGLTPTAQAALLMRRYLYEFQAPRQAFGGFPLIAHANGAGNPHAMFQKAISAEAYAKAGLVSDPLNVFDVAPVADGAAALLLTRPELLPPGFPHAMVRLAGSSLVTDTLALHDRPDPLAFHAARLSVERACWQAGIKPEQADLFELYDAYSIYAALTLEAAGMAERGQGWKLAQDGELSLQGSLPVATFGGLKARGNPGGATGVYQAVEAVLQLRGQAGVNQVPAARWAMIQALGGPASTAATHILERLD
ncbi:MAG TPA: thiolase domain-containing protein [Anaerolineales bacterium]|nr:thiolase domain-containing protein [Anaerolineales bacterium]